MTAVVHPTTNRLDSAVFDSFVSLLQDHQSAQAASLAHAELSAAIANANEVNKAALARFETPLVEDAAGVDTVGVS